MRIRRLITLCMAVVFSSAASANDAAAVDAFRRFVEGATRATVSTSDPYFNQRRSQWAKRKFSVTDLKYDVKRTDSLVNPIIGVVAFELSSVQTPLVATKEQAEQSAAYDLTSQSQFRIRLTFTHTDGAWALRDGEYEDPRMRGKFELNPAKIQAEPSAIPNAALVPWLRGP